MFLLYWKVYVLMDLAVNFLNEDLHYFLGKRIFTDGGVYMRHNGDVGSKVASSLSRRFCNLGFILVPVYGWLGCMLSISCASSFVLTVSKY